MLITHKHIYEYSSLSSLKKSENMKITYYKASEAMPLNNIVKIIKYELFLIKQFFNCCFRS